MIDFSGRMQTLQLGVHTSVNWARSWGVGTSSHIASTESLTPFRVVSGDDTWGEQVKISGSSSMPAQPGMNRFMIRRIVVVGVELDKCLARLQLTFGDTGLHTDLVGLFRKETSYWIDVMTEPVVCGVEVFASCWVSGENLRWIDFFFETCEYRA